MRYEKHQSFSPVDAQQHDRGNRGHNVSDYCRNCNAPFMEHYNSHCPIEEDASEEALKAEVASAHNAIHDLIVGSPDWSAKPTEAMVLRRERAEESLRAFYSAKTDAYFASLRKGH